MRLDKVDLNLFVVFDAIYRERSVTKVALLLNLTQPAVSNALSRLRQTFDDPLFVRTPEGMAPTPVADNVVADVREALSLLNKSVGVNARFNLAVSEKVFRLGMNDLAEALLLPHLQAAVKVLAPNVSLTSYYVAREAATEELKSGLLDLLFDVSLVNAKSLVHKYLANLTYVVAMRPENPLLQQRLTLNDYLAAEHLHVSSRRKGRGQMDVALHAMGRQRDIAMRVQNYLVAARIVEQTDLVWTVPKALADTLPLSVVAVPFTVEPMEWSLYWHKSADNDPANQWIRKIFSQVVYEVLA